MDAWNKNARKNVMKLNNKYYILRHGEALSNVKSIVSCWPEKFKNPLTPKGRLQIKNAVKKLNNKNIDLIFNSPLLRTKETADIVGEKLNVKVKIDKRLREIEFGIFNSKDVKDYENYFRGLKRVKHKPTRGENYADVLKRTFSFLKEINKKYKGRNILIVSHQAPLLLLLGKVNGYSLSDSIKSMGQVFQEKRVTKGELIELN